MRTRPGFDRVLPGLGPSYLRVELEREAFDSWTLRTFAGDGAGFVTAADLSVYEHLSWGEALDVLCAVFDGYSAD